MRDTMDYITCEKRKNAPKINVLICEKKCQHAEICTAYRGYLKARPLSNVLTEHPYLTEDLAAIKSPLVKKGSPVVADN